MKILFIQNYETLAGSENYMLHLLPAIAKTRSDISVEFLGVYKPGFEKEINKYVSLLKERGIKAYKMKTISYVSPTIFHSINRFIKKRNYAIVHSHLIYADFWIACIKKFINNTFKSVSTLHSYQVKYYVEYALKPKELPKSLYFRLAKFALNNIDVTYACSYGLQNFYKQAGLTDVDLPVIQHGFDYPEMLKKNHNNDLRYGKYQLTMVGRLIELKGHLIMLEIMPKLIEKYGDIHLVILGEGSLKTTINDIIKEKNLSKNVHVLGFKHNVLEYHTASDVAAFPSYCEGLPLSILEAMNCKTACVAFDTVGCNELIIDNETGLLAKPFEADSLFNCIVELLDNKEKTNELVDNAYIKLKQYFTLDRMTKNTIALYEKLMLS